MRSSHVHGRREAPSLLPVFVGLMVVLGPLLAYKATTQVPSNSVGVVYRLGRLQPDLLQPGYNFQVPFLDTVHSVSVSFLTERVSDVPCGCNGGITIYFDLIEVVHRLKRSEVIATVANYTKDYAQTWIVDRLHHEMNQLCSANSLQNIYITEFEDLDEKLLKQMQGFLEAWAPGIDLISIRVTKPVVPDSIMEKYSKVSHQIGKVLIREQERRTILKKAETDWQRKVKEAEKLLEVSKINVEQQKERAKSRLEIEAIADQMYVASMKQSADSLQYRLEKEADSNRRKLTPEYLQYLRAKLLHRNMVVVHGGNIPEYLINP